jgi:hypothetical protein
MARGVENVRHAAGRLDPLVTRNIQKEVEKRGGSLSSSLAKGQREKSAARTEANRRIAVQRQREEARLAETESEVGRKRLLRTTGGRQSLIASR